MMFIKGLLLILASCLISSHAQKTVCTEEALADIVFLVDGSWSIGTENFQRIREFLLTLVDSFDVGPDKVRIGLAQYSNTPRTEFYLNSYDSKQDILNYIANLPYKGGGTRTGLGLEFLLKDHFKEEAGSRAKTGAPQIAVVITDGQSQDNVEGYAQALKQQGIVLYAIGIKDADMDQLKEIATKPHDKHIYSVSDFTALQGISQSFIHVLCTTVEEAKRQVSEIPQGCRANLADIVFIVDGSSSIGDEDFLKVKRFLHTFIEGLEVRPNGIKVGLLQFSNNPHQEFLLGDYKDKKDLLLKVDRLVYRKGGTETGKALTFAQNTYFTQKGGSRAAQNVPQIAVVITDGDSIDDMKGPAMKLRNKDVLIFTIGVGAVNMSELESIANKPHRQFVLSFSNYQELLNTMTSTMDRVCITAVTRQQAEVPKFADVLVLVDSSVQQFTELRQFLIGLVNQLNVGTRSNRVALVQFSEEVSVQFLFNAYKTKNEALGLIRNFKLRRTGRRNLGKAIDFVRTNLFNSASGSRISQGFKQYLLVVSGGETEDDVQTATRLIKAEGVTIVDVDISKKVDIVLGVPYGTGNRTLLASPRTTFFSTQKNFSQIVQDVKTVIESEGVTRGACKSAQLADIVFIVDVSDAARNFTLVRSFLYHLINGLEISSDTIRVGMVLYSDTPRAEFYLNEFNNKLEILQYISILPYIGGKTNTGKALKFAREKVFAKELGSRQAQGVQQIAVVITEGKSQDDVTLEAAELRRSGVNVYAVGVQKDNMEQLKEIASYPFRRFVFPVDSFDRIYGVEKFLRKTLCNNIVRSTVVNKNRYNLKQGCKQTDEADIYFLIDDSGSIKHSDFHDMKKFILEFLQLLKIGPNKVRMGLAKYADTPTLQFDLSKFDTRESIEKAVLQTPHLGGGTRTGDALMFMRKPFQDAKTTRDVRQILIVITDGESDDKVKQPADALRDDGVSIYAIGVKSAKNQELLDIADDPGKMFFVTNYDALKPLKNEILTDICSDDACRGMLADIIFLIDGSRSIRNEDFSKMKNFINTMVFKLAIKKDKVHIGLVQFSTDTQTEFALNTYSDRDQMMEAVNSTIQMDQNTLIGRALDYVSPYFDPGQGGRPHAPKFLIVITDGESQDAVHKPAKALRDKGVIIYTIGVEDANALQLRNISGSPSNVYMERDFDALDFLDQDLLLKICNTADECQKSDIVADVVFLVDGSSSIAPQDFESMKVFMNSVVNDTQVGQDNVRFCSIIFSDDPRIIFPLNRYNSKREVQQAISDITSPSGNTETGKALKYSLAYFDKANGGRAEKGVPQIMFVITDGEATNPSDLPTPADELQDRGISVYGIGVANAKRSELETITKDKNKVFQVDDYEALKALQQNISSVLCNKSKPVCQKEVADLVILIDGSESIMEHEWKIMINFLLSLVDNLRIKDDLFRVGVAQFSTTYQKEFYLNEKMTAKDVKNAIVNIKQLSEGTKIGHALDQVNEFFKPELGSRIPDVSQNLLLITDGRSTDSVNDAADRLKAQKIEMFAVGIGNVSYKELNYIAGNRVFLVDTFDSLKLNVTIQDIIDDICTPPKPIRDPTDCTVDIAIGFDVSRLTTSPQSLFFGQNKLKAYLPEIINQISTLYNMCCLSNPSLPLQTKTGFRLVARNGNVLYDTSFDLYSEDVMKKIMAQQITQALAFNSQLLQSFQDKFRTSKAGVKVVLIFTDGLDDSVDVLRRSSEELRKSGVHALMTVALEGVQSTTELQKLEFGRGFSYKEPLTIGMQSVTSVLHKQIDSVTSRECCSVMCKCAGHEGPRGLRGQPGTKGYQGQRGHPGYPGEEGGMGERGTSGLNGTQGHQGCPGRRGLKGGRGYRGDFGEGGEDGLDGVNGEQGVTGSAGSPGERGNQGSPGQKGVPGTPGVKGEKGLRGDPGEPGLSINIRGPKGENGGPGLYGEIGQDGNPGIAGEPGKRGPNGRRGVAGAPGVRGPPGTPGLDGLNGASGPLGPMGPIGVPGQKGIQGLPGPQGPFGVQGEFGSKGSLGPKGPKGQLGDLGDKGITGPVGSRGLPGSDGPDGYGISGPKGQKGDIGFPGYPGLQGEHGDSGTPGGNGHKGNSGRGGNSGRKGSPGDPGSAGFPGHRGPRGPPGTRTMSTCQLISYVRNNCVCCKDNHACPAYPTELVIGLDMSTGVNDVLFQRMRSTLLSLIENVNIAESNCPTGARIAVVSYSSHTKYLIRFSDYRRKKDLVEAINNIALERTSNQRDIGAAMRFVGRNIFKRVRQGVLMRKVAIFLTGGPSQDGTSITTAVLEYKALDINLGVIAFRPVSNVQRAFEADETGSFILHVVERPRDQSAAVERIQQCVLCFDPCSPAVGCPTSNVATGPKEVDLDLALLVDGSRGIQRDEYDGVKQFLVTVVDQLAVSRQPSTNDRQARVALYQQSSSYSEAQASVKQIFNFQQYQDRNLMKQSIFQSLEQTGGSSRLGPALEYAITRGLLIAPKPRKNRMLLVIVGDEADYYDRAKLEFMSTMAKCEGIVTFILTVGNHFNSIQVEELASFPIEQHIVHLDHAKQREQAYAQRFLRTFLHILSRAMNEYPSPSLRRVCENFQQGQGSSRVDLEVFETAKRPEPDWIPLTPTAYPEEEFEEEFEEEEEDTRYTTETETHVVISYENGTLSHGRGDLNNVCVLEKDTGPCKAYILRWFYDSEQKECAQFWYGGCQGNDNRFVTQEECEVRCVTV